MNEEYVLPQSASEIAEAIRRALVSVLTINGATPDANGNVTITVSSEQIAAAVAAYMAAHPVVGGSTARIGEVTLTAAGWTGENNLFSQVVSIDGTTENSQVDLTPDVQQLVTFHEKDITFVTENDGGIVTVYAIGQRPANDYTIQVTITEVGA